jgi:hypothetical protein
VFFSLRLFVRRPAGLPRLNPVMFPPPYPRSIVAIVEHARLTLQVWVAHLPPSVT